MLLVITDDQPWDTLPVTAAPAAMPCLEARLDDPGDRWVRFTNAFVNVPLCCPSRASILTGRYARRTGVLDNATARPSTGDDARDVAPRRRLPARRYIGKYLNGYPWARGPFVPLGWDRFLAKPNLDVATTYRGYPFVDQGVPLVSGSSSAAYATTMLAQASLAFLRGAPPDQPWFLVFAPSAPHEPWTPAPRTRGRSATRGSPSCRRR